MLRRKKIALALSSGSAKGLAHIGAIEAIKEKNYEITAVSGSSAGSIAAALLAFNKIDEFKEWALTLDKKASLKLFDFNLLPTAGLINGNKIVKILKQFFEDKNIEDSPIPLFICATSIATGDSIYITKGNVIDALRASISIPGIFEPYKLNGIYCFDGAVSTPLPVKILMDNGFNKVIAVDLNYHIKEPPIKDMPNILSTIGRAINIVSKHSTCDAGYINKCKIIIKPNLSEFGLFDFHKAEKLIKNGYKDATKKLT